ncbi:hypothetical protein MYOV024v1_p0050 [Vibrio phage PS34B.2]|nr:hypothetical protein MYOV024v1_p0050 [Vibrio phage PS34B.2]
MKHKHYDMIVAKAANMELVVFLENNQGWSEKENQSDIQFHEQFDYFLCLPHHKEACLHWLNGGKSQAEYTKSSYPYWCDIDSDEANWSDGHIFMDKNLNIRIKPKKEKRWIAVNPDGYILPIHAGSKESIMTHASFDTSRLTANVQFIEIEVEV